MSAEKLRWNVWHWIVKLPNVCPAQAHSRIIWRDRDASMRLDGVCRTDCERNGSCWCGKLRTLSSSPTGVEQ